MEDDSDSDDSLIPLTESSEEMATGVSCCSAVKCLSQAFLLLLLIVVLFAVAILAPFLISPLFGLAGTCAGDQCHDPCGLPVPPASNSSYLSYALTVGNWRWNGMWLPGPEPLLLGFNNKKGWKEVLPGCWEPFWGDSVSAAAAVECSSSCRRQGLGLKPLCAVEASVSQLVRVCMKSYVAESFRHIPFLGLVGLALLYTLLSVATAALTRSPPVKSDASDDDSWKSVVIRFPSRTAQMPYSFFVTEITAGSLAKLDMATRFASMMSDRASDIWSIFMYMLSGQPVFASLALASVMSSGDPLQIRGLQAIDRSWQVGQPTLELWENVVEEGLLEGCMGAMLPMAAVSIGVEDWVTGASLAVSCALSMNSVFTAVQALELLAALKKLPAGVSADYLTQLALVRKLKGHGLVTWRTFCMCLLVGLGPVFTGASFGFCLFFLTIGNWMANGFAVTGRSLFPTAVPLVPMLTTSEAEPPQHGQLLKSYRILVLILFIACKVVFGFGIWRPLLSVVSFSVQLLAAIGAFVMLIASMLRESCGCCSSWGLWSKTQADAFTEELQSGRFQLEEELTAMGATRAPRFMEMESHA